MEKHVRHSKQLNFEGSGTAPLYTLPCWLLLGSSAHSNTAWSKRGCTDPTGIPTTGEGPE